MEIATKELERSANLCARCIKLCRHVCTVHRVTRDDADTPNNRAMIVTQALSRGSFLPEEVPYMFSKCANCGLCEVWCETPGMKAGDPPGIDVGDVMLAARADIVNQGLALQAAVEANCHIETEGNPLGEPKGERFHDLAEAIADLPDTAEVLYFIGCDTAYRQPEIALATIKVLKAAHVDFTVLKTEEICCGEPQYLLGFRQAAAETARKNIDLIAKTGAKKIVFNCPSCLKTFKLDYPAWGAPLPDDIKLVHLTEMLEQLLADGKLTLYKEINRKATYHDPCELGREQGIYDAPRSVIKAIPGLDYDEMLRNRDKADCCGAGGALSVTNLPVVIEASKSVIHMSEDLSAGVLITACPTCKQSFSRHTRQSDTLETLDVVELVAIAAGVQ